MKKFFFILLCGVMLASFSACNGGDDVDDPSSVSDQVYVGVVAFNKTANKMPITNQLGKVKSFIREQTNNEDFTAFCYSVSEGNKMFDASGLPDFDQIFMLNFSDGTDNYSNMLWGQEGRIVNPQEVYDACKSDLSKRAGLNSYALGFGNDAGFKTQMKKIVLGTGVYKNATSQSQLQSTFNEIAKSMISSAKNVVLKTNAGYYSDAAPKYFRFTFKSSKNVSDVILAKMTGNPNDGFTLTVTQKGKYAQFDNPVQGKESNGKVELPLRNLKFVYNNEEISFDFKVEVSFDGSKYYEDVEEASTAESISKRIAVVLVLDCSESMGSAFVSMQEAAIGLIETLTGMSNGSPDSGNTGGNSGNDDNSDDKNDNNNPGNNDEPENQATKLSFDYGQVVYYPEYYDANYGHNFYLTLAKISSDGSSLVAPVVGIDMYMASSTSLVQGSNFYIGYEYSTAYLTNSALNNENPSAIQEITNMSITYDGLYENTYNLYTLSGNLTIDNKKYEFNEQLILWSYINEDNDGDGYQDDYPLETGSSYAPRKLNNSIQIKTVGKDLHKNMPLVLRDIPTSNTKYSLIMR